MSGVMLDWKMCDESYILLIKQENMAKENLSWESSSFKMV